MDTSSFCLSFMEKMSTLQHLLCTRLDLYAMGPCLAPMHYCDHPFSVNPPLLTFHIFYSSKTTERVLNEFDKKQVLNILYQVHVF